MLGAHLQVLYVNTCTFVQVCDIKEELAGLAGPMEEMRSVCKQLQTELKKFPDCSESPFEAEADTLMDSWLDVCIYALTLTDVVLVNKQRSSTKTVH